MISFLVFLFLHIKNILTVLILYTYFTRIELKKKNLKSGKCKIIWVVDIGKENVFKKRRKTVISVLKIVKSIARNRYKIPPCMQHRESNRNKSWGDKRNRCNLFLCFHDQVYRQTLTSRAADTGIGLLSPV